MSDTRILILPGYGDSGPAHWQSLWQAGDRSSRRVSQRDWQQPVCTEWMAELEAAVSAAGPDTLLVAHSLGCLLAVHWAIHGATPARQNVRGALLVAVPDPAGPAFPVQAQGFGPVPLARLPFPSIVVASGDDPYGTPEYASACAAAWGSRLVEIGPAGHINADSGLGAWDEGRALLRGLAVEV